MDHRVISESSYLEKRIFPTIWFGSLGPLTVLVVLGGSPLTAIIPTAMIVFGYFFFKNTVWDLADEVIDSDEFLLFKRGKKEQSVRLEDIINISYQHMHSPDRVVIYSRYSGDLGKELAFKPQTSWNPFTKSPIVEELINRVESARNT